LRERFIVPPGKLTKMVLGEIAEENEWQVTARLRGDEKARDAADFRGGGLPGGGTPELRSAIRKNCLTGYVM
jgi:hypothetical protein